MLSHADLLDARLGECAPLARAARRSLGRKLSICFLFYLNAP